jgi:hypothetical protein
MLTMIEKRLFGSNRWLPNRKTAIELWKTMFELNLEEPVPGSQTDWRLTSLGRSINAELLMVFIGHHEPWEIPEILWCHGLMDLAQRDAIHNKMLKGSDPEKVLRPEVQKAYVRYLRRAGNCN